VPAGAALQDGETFVLADARGGFAVFEFDRNGDGVFGGSLAVHVTGASTEGQVGNACIVAINAAPGLGVVASSGGPQIVALVQQFPGSFGNVAIQESVGSAGFVALGMSGGQAANCTIGTACVSGSDCQSGLCDLGACASP
jgi:hypothetical protein